MKKTVRILTSDKYLYQKIFLLLSDNYDIVDSDKSDITLIDTDTQRLSEGAGIITMSRTGKAQLTVPFRPSSLLSVLGGNEGGERYISLNGRNANLSGRIIRLTEVEAALLYLLIEAEGRLVSKEELLLGVWDEKTDSGVVNVYVHYLREKLEIDGEKVIISARGKGYRINEKFAVRGAK